jgi:hypothetical protein
MNIGKAADALQKDTKLAREHGCELPPELPKRWPLGIDRIRDLWRTNAEGRLLAYLCDVAQDYEPGNTLTQYLLFGPRAYHVLHPRNVEAVLSTNFKGWHSSFSTLYGMTELFAYDSRLRIWRKA